MYPAAVPVLATTVQFAPSSSEYSSVTPDMFARFTYMCENSTLALAYPARSSSGDRIPGSTLVLPYCPHSLCTPLSYFG